MSVEITYYNPDGFSHRSMGVLKRAVKVVFGHEKVSFKRTHEDKDGILAFGRNTLSNYDLATLPYAESILCRDLRTWRDGADIVVTPFQCDPDKVLYFDTETHSAEFMWDMPPREFFRLGQYAWGPKGEVTLTESYGEMVDVIRSAEGVVAHNAHNFDLTTLFGKDSTEPLLMTQAGKVFDSMVYANLAMPAPPIYKDREGRTVKADKPSLIMKWLSLDNLCYQLGDTGKIGDLKALAKKYGGFGEIPLDDPEFRTYAEQDVVALQGLTTNLVRMTEPTAYDWREQLKAAIDAQISRNGFRVDIPVAEARVEELRVRKEELMEKLVRDYGLPTEGKMPWRSKKGKAAVISALQGAGLDPHTTPGWPQLKTGPGLGGPVLKEFAENTPAEAFVDSLAELMGQRSLAQLALDSTHSDGFTHPSITSLQRSGRSSVSQPGLTVWSARGPKAVEKSYFVPDNEDELLVEFDFSQADARIVAAYSGDKEFAKRFAPGSDAHEITGRLVFGDDVYDKNPKPYREKAKALGHAYAFRAGVNTLMRTSGQSYDVALRFVRGMEAAYPKVTAWQERVTVEGARGSVRNAWGRKMIIEPDREYNQAPAMYGQSGTRELMTDALIRMLEFDVRLTLWTKVPVHDALVFSIPKGELDWAVPKIKELMECSWQPADGTGQEVFFAVESGEPATDWFLSSH